ncbi:protein APEM9 isoform X2 [Prunus dulcis]|uniref:protein APEM9 isoform X2 n=1 Tax=Prunus dulcis TaxID=3755 RepID=UPI001483654C|nr:protein APEM9 isoform X2 [Prunus dulcis]
MKTEASESQSNCSSSTEVESGSQGKSEKDCEMEMSSKSSDPAIWEEIELSESYLVCSMYEEAASSASSILKRLSKHGEDLEATDHFELYDMLESAGMVLVQSLRELGRICFYISEGHSLGVQEFLEEFLSRWTFVDEQYVLVGTEENADYTEKCDGPFLLGVDKYLEVVEVYVLKLLGTILNDVDLARSWVENAKLPEDRRQVLLRRLHSLHSVKATNSSQGTFSSLLVDDNEAHSSCLQQITVPDGYPKNKYPPRGDTAKNQAVFNLSKRLEPCFWWFRTITLKFGSAQVVISNGKIVLGFLILLIYYVFRRKQASIKRIVRRQTLSMKNALVDLWQLAFSYQVNPLAAVQPLAAATRSGQ